VAESSPTIQAWIGKSDTLTDTSSSGNVTVTASQIVPASGDTAYAYSTGASGAVLLGVDASVATAEDNGSVTAYIDNGSQLTIAGDISVVASNLTYQDAESSGVTVGGVLGFGDSTAHADAGTSTDAHIGTGVHVSSGSLQVNATGHDGDYAKTKAGSGGLVSGNASEASTDTTRPCRPGSGELNLHGRFPDGQCPAYDRL